MASILYFPWPYRKAINALNPGATCALAESLAESLSPTNTYLHANHAHASTAAATTNARNDTPQSRQGRPPVLHFSAQERERYASACMRRHKAFALAPVAPT